MEGKQARQVEEGYCWRVWDDMNGRKVDGLDWTGLDWDEKPLILVA